MFFSHPLVNAFSRIESFVSIAAHVRHRYMLALVNAVLGLALFGLSTVNLHAGTASGEKASTDETTKVESYCHFEVRSASAGAFKLENPTSGLALGEVMAPFHTVATLYEGISNSAGAWQTSAIKKFGQEFSTNRIYLTPVLRQTNIDRYKIHIEVPDGYSVYYREAGSNSSFRPGYIFEGNVFETSAFEYIIRNTDEAGALPGKVVGYNPSTGELRMGLGFLANGTSAGYLDFKPDIKYYPYTSGSGGLDALFGRPPGAQNLYAVSTSSDVQIIYQKVPATFGVGFVQWATDFAVRQVISPQVVVDVCREGFDLKVRYFRPSQRLAPIYSEQNPYTQQTVTYPAGNTPFTFSGTPFVEFTITFCPAVTNESVGYSVFTNRAEGGAPEVGVFSFCHDGFVVIPDTEYFEVCESCEGWGSYEVLCPSCGGNGYPGGNEDASGRCTQCGGQGSLWEDCGSCHGSGVYSEIVPGYVTNESGSQTISLDGFGVKTESESKDLGFRFFPEATPMPPDVNYGPTGMRDSTFEASSSAARSQQYYEGAFPAFQLTGLIEYPWADPAQPSLYFMAPVQKLARVFEGDQDLKTEFGYYRLGLGTTNHDTHHGRIKWQTGPDGGWSMYDYSTETASLGRVTKIVTPFGDTARPADLPSTSSQSGYNITTTTYTYDWEGVKRLPATVTETSNGQQTGYSTYSYSTGSANGQPLWITTTQISTSGTGSLTSIGKFYQGATITDWLRGLPYSSQSPDGSKETAAYHRGTYNSSTKTFTTGTASTDLGFRSVVIKGSGLASSGGAALSTYDGATIDTIYLTPNLSTAEVTIRDDRAFTVRSETLLYTGGTSWVLIDSADMEYDAAGNLISRQKLNGSLYQATYTNENGSSESFSSINFTNTGTRTGQKEYERDPQGIITKFFYDAEGRVEKTIRLALPPSAAVPDEVPPTTTVFTYDDENRILSTTIKGSSPAEDVVSSTTYNRAGQVLTETSQGLTTSYQYSVTDGTLTQTTLTLPGGATRIQTNYKDGRPKSITGTAAPAEYYTYSVDGSGREITTIHVGSENSPRWTKTYTDWAGRTVQTDSSSNEGTASATLTSNSEYNSLGQLSKTSAGGLAPTLYTYDGQGVVTQSGLDLDANNTLGGTTDRINRFAYGYRHDANVWERYGGDTSTWWDYSETFAYPDGDSVGQTLTKTWSRVTNFNRVSRPPGIVGDAIAEAVAADVHGNRSITQTYLDRATGAVTTVVYAPFAAQPSITVAAAGRVVSQTSSAGVTTSFKYDSLGRPVKTIDRTSAGFSANNVAYYPGTTRLQSVTDNRGVRQHYYTYDAAGRVSSDQTPRINPSTGSVNDYNTSYFAYDIRGQLTHIWGDVPYPVNYGYNTFGDRTEQRTYRTAGINWSQSDLATNGWPGSGDLTSFAYFDETGLLKSKTDAANKAVNYTYTTLGQLKTRTWARKANPADTTGITTTYHYFSGTGALQKAEYSDGSPSLGYADRTPAIEYTYDRLGRTKTIRDATGDRTFTYRTVDLKPEAELFGRNGVGSTTSHLLGTARQLTYQYDPTTGRFLGTDFSQNGSVEHSVSYGFDPVSSRLKTIASGAGVFRYSYTPNSNLIAGVTRGSFTQARTYEANRNNLDTLTTTTQGGTLAGYDYTSDDLGRRTSVEQSGMLYAPYLAVSQIMKTVYGYNERNEATSSVTSTGAPGSQAALAGRNFGYDFDPIGNRTKEKFEGVEHAYTADALNRYTDRATPSYLPVSGTANNTGGASLSINGSTLGSGSWRNNYFYQSVNKTQTGAGALQSIGFSASSGGNSQSETAYSLTRPTAESFTYDDDGNLTSDSLWVYVYDGQNQLKAMYAKVADQTGFKVAATFVYDYMGRRVGKTVWNNTGSAENPVLASRRSQTFFAWRGWSLAAEFDGNLNDGSINTLIRRFTFGVDLSGSLGGAGDIGGLLAIEDLRTGLAGTYLGIHDGNGNLTALADGATGTLAAEYEYDPSGNVLRASGSYGKENPFRFAGKYFDTETGLSYYGFRYYSASLGKFINRDPIGESGGMNLFSNASNDTINGWDYLGLDETVMLPPLLISASRVNLSSPTRFAFGIRSPADLALIKRWFGSYKTGWSDSNAFGYKKSDLPKIDTQKPTVDGMSEDAHQEITEAQEKFNEQVRENMKEFAKGALEGAVMGVVGGVAVGVAVATVGLPVTIAVGGFFAIKGAYEWAKGGFQWSWRDSGRAIGGLLTGGIGARLGNSLGTGLRSTIGRIRPRGRIPSTACFVAGTLIATATGFAEIQNTKVGDSVWSYNVSAEEWELQPVTKIYEHEYTGDIIEIDADGEKIEATGNHPFWVCAGSDLDTRPAPADINENSESSATGRWVEARDLMPGDVLRLVSGRSAKVRSAFSRQDSCKVYNLEVAHNHTYAVSGLAILVHNKTTGEDALGIPTEKSRTKWGPEHGKGNTKHNNAIEDSLDDAAARGATDLRKNRVQRDAQGNRVRAEDGSYTRPDGAWVDNGVRHNYNRVSDLDSLDRELDAFRKMIEADPNAVNSLEF